MHKPKRYLKPLLLLGVAYLGYLLFFAKEPEEVDVFARYLGPNRDIWWYHYYQLPLHPKQPLKEEAEYGATRMDFATGDLQEYDRYADIPADLRKGLESLTGSTKMVIEGESQDTIAITRDTDSLWATLIDLRMNLSILTCCHQATPKNEWLPKTLARNSVVDIYYLGMTKTSAILVYHVREDGRLGLGGKPNYDVLLMRLDGHRITHSWEFLALSPVRNRSEALALCPPIHFKTPTVHDSLLSYR